MPFPHNTTDRPDAPLNPGQTEVNVTFEGLLVLRAQDTDDPQTKVCEIGVANAEIDHTFVIEVSVVGNGRLWNFGGPPGGPFEIRADDAASGVQAFMRDENPFNRSNAANDELDFRWVLDLKHLHPSSAVNDIKIRPSVQLNRGLLYASQVTPLPPAMEVFRTAGGQSLHSLRRIAFRLGARVVLGMTEKLRIIRNGLELYSIPRPPHEVPPGSSYLIKMSNLDISPPTAVPGDCSTGDFTRYYHVIDTISTPNQFDICFFTPPTPLFGTTDVPCMAVVTDGGWTET